MKKRFLIFSTLLIVATAILSVIFSVVYFVASEVIVAGEGMLTFTYYLKKFFDLVAVFTGYAIIIYSFARFDTMSGLKSIGVFSISFLISFIYQFFGICFYQNDFSAEFIISTIYYAFGNCFITQILPAFVVAFIAYRITKNGTTKMTKLFSLKNPIQKTMFFSTLVIFGINLACLLGFDTFPFLFEADFYITKSEFWAVLGSVFEVIIIYLVIEYVIYVLMYLLCDWYHEKYCVKTKKTEIV